jgi:Mce-associated membrane protein
MTQTPTTTTRRRRIAGERRPATEQVTGPAEAPTTAARPTAGAAEDVGRTAQTPPPSDADPTPERAPRRPVGRWQLVVLAVIAAVLVALAAGPVVPGVGIAAIRQNAEHDAVAAASRAAPAAAERAAAAILAYDHEALEADRDNAARFMTGDYRKEYLDTFGLVLDNAPKVKAVVEAEVRASGVVHADADRVDVLLFVNQTTTSTANDEPQTALNRVRMTMQEQDGTWLVDDITSY